ncbi:MAG: DinB family protein [Desulfobacterales bacterium]|nr:DinB family protein [Desulfobacterales bacterium]
MVDVDPSKWERLAANIESTVNKACQELENIASEVIEAKPEPVEWSVKEVIGHLVDSASNNHQRFVRLQVDDSLFFPDYSQDNDAWVSIQGYQEASWHDLLALWRYFNLHIAHVIRTVDEDCQDHIWVVDEDTAVTLGELMIDYLRHLQDHLQRIKNLMDRSA